MCRYKLLGCTRRYSWRHKRGNKDTRNSPCLREIEAKIKPINRKNCNVLKNIHDFLSSGNVSMINVHISFYQCVYELKRKKYVHQNLEGYTKKRV